MGSPKSMSLSSYLRIVVSLTILALIVIVAVDAWRRLRRESAAVDRDAQRMAEFVSGDVEQLLETSRHVLIALSEAFRLCERIGERDAWFNMAREVVRLCPYYVNFGVMLRQGEMLQAATAPSLSILTQDSDILRKAVEGSDLAVGSVRFDYVGGKDILCIAYCVRDKDGEDPIVSLVALDFAWLEHLLSEERVSGRTSLFPEAMVLDVIDRKGTILTRYPENELYAGQVFRDQTVLKSILTAGNRPLSGDDVDGVFRTYKTCPVKGTSDLFVIVGISKPIALNSSRRDVVVNLAGMVLLCFGLFVTLNRWVDTRILRPINKLLLASRELGAGDFRARSDLYRGPREIMEVGATFDQAAGMLESRDAERRKTEEKMIEYDKQLRRMTIEHSLAEGRERNHIALGLHDDVGPILATCYMKLGRAMKLSNQSECQEVLEECRDLVNRSIEALRSLTFDLSSPVIQSMGLVAALNHLCGELEGDQKGRFSVDDQSHGLRLKPDLSILLYRIVRELLINVQKHAETTETSISLRECDGHLAIQVEDNGIGFDSTAVGTGFSRTGGFGLFSIKERVEGLGGHLVVDSRPGKGTRVTLTIPIMLT